MYDTKTIRRHANLFLRMAEAEGIDLDETVLRAQIMPDDVVDGVLRCTGCTSADACEKTLDSGEHHGGVPSYCQNAAMLAALKDMG